MATYNAYAANLLTEHGLRIGHEPDTRVVTDAARYQLGARVVDRYTGVVEHLTDHAETAIQNLLALDSTLSEHLRSPDEVRAFDAAERPGFLAARLLEEQGKHRATYLGEIDKADLRHRPSRRAARAGRGLPSPQGRPGPHGLLRPDRPGCAARRRAARRRRGRARQVPGGAPRRVPGHLGRPGAHAVPALLRPRRGVRAGPRRHRGGRPQPGHLRLARCLGVQHPQLRRHLPGRRRRSGPGAAADRQPALRHPDPRPGQRAGPAVVRRLPAGLAAGRRRGRGARPRADPGLRDPPRGAGGPGRAGPRRPHPHGRLVAAGRAHPRQRARRGGLRRPHQRRRAGRDRRSLRAAPAARGGRDRGHAAPACTTSPPTRPC